MDDLIRRQAAIDAIMGQPPEPHYPAWYAAQIEKLPAVQPATNCSEIPNSSDDTISRQAAIDALHTWFRDGFDEDKWWNSTHVLAAIEGLLSAQQGYKWETCFDCPLSHGCPKIKGCTNEQAIEYASQIPNDCPLSTQPDHIAESGKKVEQTGETAQNVQNEDLISRKWLVECIEEGWVKFDTAKDCNRMMHLVRDIAPSVQPEQNAQDEDLISREAAIEALARMMPRSYTPDGSHPADEEIFRVQEVFADCIEALEILPSAQPESHWVPCSERLPERADNVIICYKAGDYTLVSTGRYLYKFKMWYVDVVGDLRDGVTAWMPLPEPYRGGEKE